MSVDAEHFPGEGVGEDPAEGVAGGEELAGDVGGHGAVAGEPRGLVVQAQQGGQGHVERRAVARPGVRPTVRARVGAGGQADQRVEAAGVHAALVGQTGRVGGDGVQTRGDRRVRVRPRVRAGAGGGPGGDPVEQGGDVGDRSGGDELGRPVAERLDEDAAPARLVAEPAVGRVDLEPGDQRPDLPLHTGRVQAGEVVGEVGVDPAGLLRRQTGSAGDDRVRPGGADASAAQRGPGLRQHGRQRERVLHQSPRPRDPDPQGEGDLGDHGLGRVPAEPAEPGGLDRVPADRHAQGGGDLVDEVGHQVQQGGVLGRRCRVGVAEPVQDGPTRAPGDGQVARRQVTAIVAARDVVLARGVVGRLLPHRATPSTTRPNVCSNDSRPTAPPPDLSTDVSPSRRGDASSMTVSRGI
nr:hypothetical protein [Pseudokineococcus lusitanus]